MEFTRLDLGDGVFRQFLHVVRHVGEWRQNHHAVLHAAPGVGGAPGAVEHRLDAGDVIGIPVVGVGSKLRLGSKLDHVGGLAEALLALLLGDLQRSRRVGVLHHDVGALAEQHLGGIGFLAGIVPGIHPDDLHLEIRIDRLRAQHEAVDAHDDFRNREGDDVARHTGFRHLGGDLAHHVAALVEAGVVDRHVAGLLEAGGMFELDIGIFGRDLDGWVHEAEGRGEDDLATVARQALDGAFGVGAFGDILEEHRLDLVAQFLFHGLAAEVMLVGISEIADWAHIDPAGLELLLGL